MAEGPLCRAPPKPISNRSLRKEGPVVFGDGGAGRDRPHWANNAPGNLTNVGLTLTPECERPGLYIFLYSAGADGQEEGVVKILNPLPCPCPCPGTK